MMPASNFRVKTGLDVLLEQNAQILSGQRIGLVSHPAAVQFDLTHCLDRLISTGTKITALFGPEHGFHAAEADGAVVGDATDSRTGLPVFSLYGPTKAPTAEMMERVDSLVFDMQDVGVRFYTYLSTLYYTLHSCAQFKKTLFVLDRPNPINGIDMEGWALDAGLDSFVGIVSVPIRHGMTLGELALWMNTRHSIGADLHVVKMQGWNRGMWFDQTGLPWVPTSPGIPQFVTTILYPGTCFIEGTNLSEGRGTSQPFEICGAPWINAYDLAESLNLQNLPGVRFRPLRFIPSASKHAGLACAGVQLHVTDRSTFKPVITGIALLKACREQDPDHFQVLPSSWEGRPPHMDLLAGTPAVREGLLRGDSYIRIYESCSAFLGEFSLSRRQFLLYGED